MKCPMCRQLITCLLPLYTRNEQQQFANEHKETFDYISVYNRRFSGAPRPVSLIKKKKKLPNKNNLFYFSIY